MAHAEREQLHQFAGQILIRMPLAVGRCVQVDEQSRLTNSGAQQVGEVRPRVPAQRVVLAVHQGSVLDLAVGGGEMIVPEEGEALG